MYSNITGIILSGGKSKRMGSDKSFLMVGNKYIIQYVTELMKNIFGQVILITNEPKKYKFLEIDCYEDIIKEMSPICGIHSGLSHSKTERNFIISCDMPLITKEIISFIIDFNSKKDVIVPFADGYIQQLCGIYSKCLLPNIEQIITINNEYEIRNNKQNKRHCPIMNLIESVNSEIIDIEKEYPNYKIGYFLNMNKPEDYEVVVRRFNNNNNL